MPGNAKVKSAGHQPLLHQVKGLNLHLAWCLTLHTCCCCVWCPQAKDARNFVNSLQYWLGGNTDNLENLLLNVVQVGDKSAVLLLECSAVWILERESSSRRRGGGGEGARPVAQQQSPRLAVCRDFTRSCHILVPEPMSAICSCLLANRSMCLP